MDKLLGKNGIIKIGVSILKVTNTVGKIIFRPFIDSKVFISSIMGEFHSFRINHTDYG